MVRATSRRPRKRHVQQALFRNGGKRKGAGRKPKGDRAGSRHEKRPVVKSWHALHVILRVVPEVGSLRRRGMYQAIREATVVAAVRERIRIVHISLQRTHVHLLVEAENAAVLARGMQGFMISAARNINTLLGDGCRRRRGRVFAVRYHLVIAKTPRHVRNLIAYVRVNRPICRAALIQGACQQQPGGAPSTGSPVPWRPPEARLSKKSRRPCR